MSQTTRGFIDLTRALPHAAYCELDRALGVFCEQAGDPGTDPLARGIWLTRCAIAAVRNSITAGREMDQIDLDALDGALTGLADLDTITWSTFRWSLIDGQDQNLDAGSIPLAAWLCRFVLEVDGRRLDNSLALERLAEG